MHIRIKGNLNYYEFMNKLVDKIKEEFKEEILLDTNKSKKKYEFKIIFEADDDEGKDNEQKLELNLNNFIDEEKDCSIQIKLYEFGKGEYLLRFIRISGSLAEFYSKGIKLVDLAKNLL